MSCGRRVGSRCTTLVGILLTQFRVMVLQSRGIVTGVMGGWQGSSLMLGEGLVKSV